MYKIEALLKRCFINIANDVYNQGRYEDYALLVDEYSKVLGVYYWKFDCWCKDVRQFGIIIHD